MSEQEVLYSADGGIGVITLNRPHRHNALNRSAIQSLEDLLEDLARDRDLRVLILRGNGKSFCSGGDVEGWGDEKPPWRRHHGERMVVGRLRRLDVPVIAAVHGYCLGAGLSLALGCDLRIAAADARFGLPYVQRGICADWGVTYTLPRIVGTERALRLLLTGRWFGAEEALQWGLVGEVVPAAQLETATMALAQELLKAAPIAAGLIKAHVYRAQHLPLEDVLELEMFGVERCFETEDAAEGVRAFMEKRAPVFTGR